MRRKYTARCARCFLTNYPRELRQPDSLLTSHSVCVWILSSLYVSGALLTYDVRPPEAHTKVIRAVDCVWAAARWESAAHRKISYLRVIITLWRAIAIQTKPDSVNLFRRSHFFMQRDLAEGFINMKTNPFLLSATIDKHQQYPVDNLLLWLTAIHLCTQCAANWRKFNYMNCSTADPDLAQKMPIAFTGTNDPSAFFMKENMQMIMAQLDVSRSATHK